MPLICSPVPYFKLKVRTRGASTEQGYNKRHRGDSRNEPVPTALAPHSSSPDGLPSLCDTTYRTNAIISLPSLRTRLA